MIIYLLVAGDLSQQMVEKLLQCDLAHVNKI